MNTQKFKVTLKFKSSILGLKSADPFVFLGHQVEKARAALAQWSKSNTKNKGALPYLGADNITDKQVLNELENLKETCELMLGEKISKAIWKDACENGLSKNTRLYVMLNSLKGSTVFLKDGKNYPFFQTYAMKGMLKELGQIFCERSGSAKGVMFQSASYTAQQLNRHVFVNAENDKIYFYKNKTCKGPKMKVKQDSKGNTDWYSRPLKAKTAQGPRITLAKSEVIEAPCYITFEVKTFLAETVFNKKVLATLLSIGEDYGCSQWRNAGNGTFEVESIK